MSQKTIKTKAKKETATEFTIHQIAPCDNDAIAIHCTLAGAEVAAIIAPNAWPRAEYLANPLAYGPASSVVQVVFGAALKLDGESQADAVARLRSNATGAGQAWAAEPEGRLKVWLEGR